MIKICTTKDEMIDSYQIRKTVFIEEQAVSYEEEFDLQDKDYIVYLLYEGQVPISTARYKLINSDAKVGRVCTLKAFRGKHYGIQLMERIISDAFNQGAKRIVLDSQLTAQSFYERLGFVAYGDIFLDANIEHTKMELKRKSKS